MTLALRRFHLDGIGPPGARFDPLRVDLAGRDDDRAAQAAVLFLENGGGKSVLLRLLFSVVLPGRRSTVGGARLEGYVGSGDTGHVVIEWDTPDDRRLVTGTVLEWRNRTRSATAANLLQSWYSFVPQAGMLDLDSLPLREDGRRVTRSGFKERLSVLGRADQSLELVIEDGPGPWADHLTRATPLDPAMFGYQRKMNADEADAESLFAGVRDDDDFVRFVIDAVHDPEEIGEFAAVVAGYADQLARRGQLDIERDFCERAAAALRPLGASIVALRTAEVDARLAGIEAQRLRSRVVARIGIEETAARLHRRSAEQASEQAAEADRQSTQASAIAAELRRLEAEFLLEAAKEEEDRENRRHATALLDVNAWQQVGSVLEESELTCQHADLRRAQETVDRALEPLRRAADGAAASYAGRLGELVGQLVGQAEEAEAAAAGHDLAARESTVAADEASRAGGAAEARADSLRGRVAEVEESVTEARHHDLIRAGEDPSAAHARIEEEAGRAEQKLLTARRRRGELTDQAEQLGEQRLTLVSERDKSVNESTALRRELDRYRQLAGEILDQARTQQLAPGAEDAWVVSALLEAALERRVADGENQQRRLASECSQLAAQIEALGIDGLLPAPADVQQVCDAIADAGIPVTTGWTHLARLLDPEERNEALARNPAVAGGVLVTEPGDLETARRAVLDAGVETEHVVLIATAPDLGIPAQGFAAPVRRALYDPDWTERTRVQFIEELGALDERRQRLTEELVVDVPLLGRVRRLASECPADKRDGMQRTIDVLSEEATELQRKIDDVALARQEATRALGELAETDRRLEEDARSAADNLGEIQRLVGEIERAHGWSIEAMQQDATAQGQRRLAEAQAASAQTHRSAAEAARRRADHRRREADDLRSEIGRLGVEAAVPPASTPTEDLRAAATAARQAYDAERQGKDLTPEIEAVEARLAAAASRLAGVSSDVLSRSRVLAPSVAGLDQAGRRARAAEAERTARSASEAHQSASVRRGQAEQVLADRTPPPGRQRHYTLDESEVPPDAETAARWAVERQSDFVRLTSESRTRQAEAQRHQQEALTAETHVSLLSSAVTLLPGSDDPSQDLDDVDPWDGQPQDASGAASTTRVRVETAARVLAEARHELDRAEMTVRNLANDPGVSSVGGVRVALAGEERESLADRSESLADELDGMRRSIEAELSDVARHREALVVRLTTLVEAQLRLLGRLERLSALPPGLGEWSGKPFLTVTFAKVEPGELPARLLPIVEAAASDPRKREPVALLFSAVRAAVAEPDGDAERTFRVRLLRPNRTMQLQWATVPEMEREFSGGMKLTAAICTYCALAALRAHSRSTGRLFGQEPGPLFLDNPLGKASADYLLDLQHAIAEKLRVQLIHTTGVWDVEALATYERVVRLRNLADLRRNVHRLQADDLPHGLVPAGEAGVDAVSFSRRRAH